MKDEDIRWLICTRCHRIYHDGGMKYVGNGQWMCEACYDDMYYPYEDKEEEE